MAFSRIALGAAAMSAVSVIRLVAQFFVVPILSRLLSPADYGLMAMAMPFVIFMMAFTDAGVGQSLVRAAQKEDQKVWSTSFWLTLISGSALAVLIICLAPLAAWFFKEPRLQPIVMALALVIIPQAGATIPEASLRQDQRFGTIAATEIAAVLSGIFVAVIIAFKGGGAWALVAQQLALYSLRFILTFPLSSFRPTLNFDLKEITSHLTFGRDLLAARFVWFLSGAMDSPIIGKVLGAAVLGTYTMAFMLARLPGQLVMGPLHYVLYAHLVKYRHDAVLLKRALLMITRMVAIVIFPGMAMLAAAHHAVFTLFLSAKWQHSGTLFMIAAPAAALSTVTSLRGMFMMVIGKTNIQLRSSIESLFVLATAYLIFVHFGINWFVVGYNVAIFLYFPRGMTIILPHLGCTLAEFVKVLIAPAAMAGVCVLVFYELNQLFVIGNWSQLFMGGALGLLGIGGSALLQYRALSGEIILLRGKW